MAKIIFVEDTNILKLRLELLIRNNGLADFEAISTSTLASNYKKINADLYIIDLDYKKNGGVDLINKIKAIDNKPIIALSSKTDISHLKQAIVSGCNDFIIKPFDDKALAYKIKKLIGLEQNSTYSPNQYRPETIETGSESKTVIFWDKQFEIDVKEIDADHKSIIMSYQKLYSLMKEGKGHHYYKELVEFLQNYINTHFAREEVLHKRYDYTLKDEHHQIHIEFVASINKLIEKGTSESVTNIDIIKMNLFIKQWLIHHILVEDLKFGAFLKKNNIDI